jgi:predicted  nucleic acid-binding Zn ribbon protein
MIWVLLVIISAIMILLPGDEETRKRKQCKSCLKTFKKFHIKSIMDRDIEGYEFERERIKCCPHCKAENNYIIV